MHTRLEIMCYNVLGTQLNHRNMIVNKIYPHPFLHRFYNCSEIYNCSKIYNCSEIQFEYILDYLVTILKLNVAVMFWCHR